MRVRQTALDAIVEHAREEAPHECCGLLIGSPDVIERAAPARNLRASATRYLIDPVDHFAALRAARAEGRTVVGAYHSHPASPPVPSATDQAEATYSDFLYVIVSPGRNREGTKDAKNAETGPEVRAYRLRDGTFEPVTLVPVP